MTYRRLFHALFIMSAVTFAGLWWGSLRSVWTFGYSSSPETSLVMQIDLGTVRIGLTDLNPGSSGFRASRVPIQPYEYKTLREVYGHPGKFRLREYPVNLSTTTRNHNYVLWFPIWLPCVLAVGMSYCLMRAMERRPRGRQEKALAESTARAKDENRQLNGN